MRKRKPPKTPQHLIDAAVKRHFNGESVVTLAAEHHVSRPGFYLWIKHAKAKLFDKFLNSYMPPAELEALTMYELRFLRGETAKQNVALRSQYFKMMFKGDDFGTLFNP